MTPKEAADVAEIMDIIRKLPEKLRVHVYFMIIGARLIADEKKGA